MAKNDQPDSRQDRLKKAKWEAADELGVPLSEEASRVPDEKRDGRPSGVGGSRSGSIGGRMVRNMIRSEEEKMAREEEEDRT